MLRRSRSSTRRARRLSSSRPPAMSSVCRRPGFAFPDVALTIDQGGFAFLVGSSSACKSTLIKLLIRDALPTTGRVTVDGNDVGKLRRSQVPHLRRLVGVVFQDFKLLPTKTVTENIAFALLVTGHEGRVVREETDRTLALVGLAQRRGHFPREP